MHDFFDIPGRLEENGFLMRITTAERRLCHRGDFRQLGRDISQESWMMAPFIAVTKAGNALVGEFSDREPEQLGTSGVKFTARDVRSAVGNLFQAGKNLITLHPLRAVGNVAKAGMDAIDVPFDLALDAGSALTRPAKQTRSAVSYALAA